MSQFGGLIDGLIATRENAGATLAEKFPEWRGLPFEAFLDKLAEVGLELDFITAATMHERLNAPKEDS